MVATIATIIALPAIWLFTRGEASSGTGAPNVAAVGVATPQAGGTPSTAAAPDPFGTNEPIFIDGPTTPPRPAVVQIVVPAQVPGSWAEGGASYRRSIGGGADTCSSPDAPFGIQLTVTNRDNGQQITCINRAPEPLVDGLSILLTTDQFEKIGQLVDAPIPVRITWNGSE
jgi:hypothetical protein